MVLEHHSKLPYINIEFILTKQFSSSLFITYVFFVRYLAHPLSIHLYAVKCIAVLNEQNEEKNTRKKHERVSKIFDIR
jgi:hypothetical protein